MKCVALLLAAMVFSGLACRTVAQEVEAMKAKPDDDVQILRDCIFAVKSRKHQQKYRAIIAESRNFLAPLKAGSTTAELSAAQKKDLAGLLKRFKPLVAKLEKWDAGHYTLATAREVRLANATRARRQKLWETYLADCKVKNIAPKTRAQWDEQWPTRVIFSQNFEGPPTKAHDWLGTTATDNVPPGSKRALAAVAPKKWFAQRIRVGIYYDNARMTTTNWVRFKYFINKSIPIGVFVFDMTLHNNWETTIPKPVVGKWTEVTLDIATFREKSSRQRKVQPGDGIDDIFVHAGKPGDRELKLLIDDAMLIGRD